MKAEIVEKEQLNVEFVLLGCASEELVLNYRNYATIKSQN